jgi:2-dehydropantoate 2-reductase
MAYVVVGAGAVGGTIGARLYEAGYPVRLVARGAHLDALAERGLLFEEPESSRILRVPVAGSVEEVDWRPGDVAVLATKSQDSEAVLEQLHAVAPRTAVVCAQNGVANERFAAGRFDAVQSLCVMLPAEHLEPGRVVAYSAPTPGILDAGAYPRGVTEQTRRLVTDLRGAGFSSRAQDRIMRWKYRKLVSNLANAAQAACGAHAADLRQLVAAARREGRRCLSAARIDMAGSRENRARRGALISMRPVNGRTRQGGSTWQSLTRATGTVEARFLNGEIVELGRRYGVPTPVNALLLDIATTLAGDRTPPGGHSATDLLRLADRTAMAF